jgi:acylphosphatase
VSHGDKVARRYVVTGRVQGVGYRNFVEYIASKLGLTGYVRNLSDGNVEVFAMGTPESLSDFRKALAKGPMMAKVSGVNEEPSAPNAAYDEDFRIETTH